MPQLGWWDSAEWFFSASNLGAVVDPEQNFWTILWLWTHLSPTTCSLPPSMLRWVYKHLLLLGVRPVPVRQSCPAASQLLSLHRCLQTVIKPASQPAALPQTSPVHCVDIFHSRACFPNVLSILLLCLETLSSFWCSPWGVQRCSPGLKTEVMKASHTHRLALFKCPWVSGGHKKLPEEIRSGNLS